MHRFIVSFVLSAFFALAAGTLSAQNVQVTGRIVDATGAPLVAVTVYEAGNTSNGAASDLDGNYSISVPQSATLVFSCLGFEEVREAVGKRSVINVTLNEEQLSLDAAEVVSIGYGSVARRDLTGSVSKVDMGDIMKTPVTNFDQALTGRVAGVVVSTSDGSLGAEANIVIRGNNSLTQSSAPLYVIDGFPSESSMALSLNSADIESIDILKDASATAIYGARGANGVIVITTKQGIEGKPKVNFSSSWTYNEISNKVDLMDAYEFVDFQTDKYAISGGTNIYLEHDGQTYSLEDYRNVRTYDWQDRIYRPAFVQNYNISLSGGSKEAGNRYNASFSVLDQDGIIVNSNFQRYQGKINFSQNIGKKVKADLNVNYSRTITKGTNPTSAQQSSSASGWLMYSVWGYRPVKPIWDEGSDDEFLNSPFDEEIADASDYRFNPALSVRNEYRRTVQDYLNGQLGLTWTIIPDLVFKTTGTYTYQNRRREEFNNSMTYTGNERSPSGNGINGAIYWTNWVTWLNENTLTWTKHIKRKHHLNLLAGVTFQGQTNDYKGTRSTNMTTEALGLNGMHTGNYQTVTPWEYNWRMMSGLFRLQYNYKYKYYLTASFRADGSSKFPPGNQWGYFPSGSFAWNFNREDLLKDSSWLKNGKLRLSWGLTGNNRTTTPYDFYAQIATTPGSSDSYDYVFGGEIVPGYYPANMANDDLRWETTEQWNAGIDLSFFEGDRIKLTADWYMKNTYDLLLQATMPSSTGYESAMMNIGSMRNSGVELSLETVNINRKNFQWTTSFNIAFNRNKVTALTSGQQSLLTSVYWEQRFNSQYPYITQVGKPSGMMYGYVYEGTYKADEFTGNYLKDGIPYMSSVGKDSVKPGDPKYSDINGDGIIDDNDRTIIGCGQPLHTGGFGNSFYFYGFDLNIFFTWSYGNDILNANRLIFENGNIANLNQFATYVNRYDAVKNPDSDIPAINANGMFVYSSRVVEDGSYLRLKNISLGYTLPRKALRKMHFDTLRVYVSADNIWTWTKYSGPDPEVSTRNSVLTPGFDWSAYPRAFGLTAGLSFTF
ncbi:MAG: TonB-dependent receptor [Bacteroidetes bacterium]|uniref:TonB-dependent receptor n=1 Tax=Candidatus Cryptobacteroides merdavium TaxID=2840769 RepID=A0A9D9EIW0_9BACT|nr:TonB-dependent receptor [Candidatus Cryptobacteroides merdavium]